MDSKLIIFHMSALIIVASLQVSSTQAFEVNTHEALSFRSVDSTVTGASKLDNFLREILRHDFYSPERVQQGMQQSFNGKRVWEWIQFGSKEEDNPWMRLNEHFHDPTKPWDQAGILGISSVIWSQLLNQGNGVGGGNHSWPDARESYFRALTETDPAQRKQYWADTFQSVGQLIHLVQDAASPAHSRNDLHPSLFGIGFTDRLHVWGETDLGIAEVDNSGSQRYDSSILNLPPNNFAPIPIARIIDTEKLRGGNPSEGLDIGIAEYSNANFFSDRTIFSPNYQTPTDLGFIAEPGPNGKVTQYLYRHAGSPATRYKLAVAGSLADSVTLPEAQIQWALDDYVMADYGKNLFPRAIGYSAGMIDYFFRGKIDSTPWPPGYVLVPWSQRPTSIRVENVSVKADETNEQGGQGTMRLVLLYSYRYEGTPPGAPEVVVSQPVSVSASSSPQTVVFPFDSLPFPLTYPDASGSHIYGYAGILVYKGALGQESEAVVGAGYCFDPSNGSRYDRVYQFEHSVPGLWFDEGAAYIDYFGC